MEPTDILDLIESTTKLIILWGERVNAVVFTSVPEQLCERERQNRFVSKDRTKKKT